MSPSFSLRKKKKTSLVVPTILQIEHRNRQFGDRLIDELLNCGILLKSPLTIRGLLD